MQNLTGAQWVGNLSYLDYGKNVNVSIPSNLTVSASKNDKMSWVFTFQYPDEPKANRQETIMLSQDGKIFDGEKVVKKTKLPDKTLKIVTEKSGKDNDKNALFRYTYSISKNTFSIKKEVQYEGTSDFFVRNEYKWKR